MSFKPRLPKIESLYKPSYFLITFRVSSIFGVAGIVEKMGLSQNRTKLAMVRRPHSRAHSVEAISCVPRSWCVGLALGLGQQLKMIQPDQEALLISKVAFSVPKISIF